MVRMKPYGKSIKCRLCKEPLIAHVLENSWSDNIVKRPHLELVCINCQRGHLAKQIFDLEEEKSDNGNNR